MPIHPQLVFVASGNFVSQDSGHYTPYLLKCSSPPPLLPSGMLLSSLSSSSCVEVTLGLLSDVNTSISLSATLHKKGNSKRAWLPRHCVLKSCYIFYFQSSKPGTAASGVIPLHECTLTLPPNNNRVFKYHKSSEAREGYEFAIKTCVGGEGKDRDFYLTAESEAVRREWSEKVNEARAEYGSEVYLKPAVAQRAKSAEAYFRLNPSTTAASFIRSLEAELEETDGMVKKNCMEFYPDLVLASRQVQEFGEGLEVLDEQFEAVSGAMEKISRWEGEWSDGDSDDGSTSDSEGSDDGDDADGPDGGDDGADMLRDHVDNLDFAAAADLIEAKEEGGEDASSDRLYAEAALSEYLEPFNPDVFRLYVRVDEKKAVRWFEEVCRAEVQGAVKGSKCLEIVRADKVLFSRWMVGRFFEVMEDKAEEWERFFGRDLKWVKFVMEAFEGLAAALYGQKALGGLSLDEGGEGNKRDDLFEKIAEVLEMVGEKSADFEERWGMPVLCTLVWKGCECAGLKSRVKDEWQELIQA